MKITNSFFILSLTMFLFSCNAPQGEKANVGEALEASEGSKSGQEMTVNTGTSAIEWTGTKPGGQHNGTVGISKGVISADNGRITGGMFSIDMNSIVNQDLEDAEWNTKLVGHLKSDDFFSVEKHPEATFEIVSVEKFEGIEEPQQEPEGQEAPTHMITGNLTIKGITRSVTFGAYIQLSDTGIFARTPLFKIDRTEWDIQYQSNKFFDNLKDKFIHDEISLRIVLNAS